MNRSYRDEELNKFMFTFLGKDISDNLKEASQSS